MKQLSDSIATLNGVGPKRVETLKTLHIETINDLLTHYPFRYDDIQEKKLEEISDQEKVVLKGIALSDGVVMGIKKAV